MFEWTEDHMLNGEKHSVSGEGWWWNLLPFGKQTWIWICKINRFAGDFPINSKVWFSISMFDYQRVVNLRYRGWNEGWFLDKAAASAAQSLNTTNGDVDQKLDFMDVCDQLLTLYVYAYASCSTVYVYHWYDFISSKPVAVPHKSTDQVNCTKINQLSRIGCLCITQKHCAQ